MKKVDLRRAHAKSDAGMDYSGLLFGGITAAYILFNVARVVIHFIQIRQ